MRSIEKAYFILYVRDQVASSDFYSHVLNTRPTLHVPGMTEFEMGDCAVLGLMPESGIARLLGMAMNEPPHSFARGEVYLVVDDPETYHQRALAAGARELSSMAPRDWGDQVAYSLDLNGYVLAFSSHIETPT